MKFSEYWLREWVNPPLTTADLATQLTMAGLEVEAIEAVAPRFADVVVGEVTALEAHPNADKLRVCTVNVGAAAPLQIVCGAANVHVGMKAPCALVGAVLPGGLSIKRAKLRGIESCGMLCSAQELGLAEAAEGLLPLPHDAVPGQDVRALLRLDDVSLTLKLTPNRADCLSVAGVAREVAALNNLAVRGPDEAAVASRSEHIFPVQVMAPAACPRYCGRVVTGVDPNVPTPLWLRERLRRSGVRSISAVVDVTNYVLLELGQPLHAFDLATLHEAVQVRWAQAGERLLLLDGQQVELTPDVLVIADAQRVLALAGVMGGADSAIGSTTTALFLESAFFAPTAIQGRARRYGLHTDSAQRFERGVDPLLTRRALERATELIIAIAGGVPGPIVETGGSAPDKPPILLRRARLHALLGISIDDTAVVKYLQGLGMIIAACPEGWYATPPSWRFDLTIEADLIEEVVRLYGYHRVPEQRGSGAWSVKATQETQVGREAWRQVLVERGYQEAITYSFGAPEWQQRFTPELAPLALLNPISSELGALRTSLWPGLVQAVLANQRRQQARVRLFEIGRRFVPTAETVIEEEVIAGVAVGTALGEQWGTPGRAIDFFDVKADIQALLGLTGHAEDFIFNASAHAVLHPGQSARITTRDGATVGWLGTLHPAQERELGLAGRALLFELATAPLAVGVLPHFSEVSRFPAVRRDLALVMPEAVSFATVKNCIRAVAGDILREVVLFDIYRGAGVAADHKSMALGLLWQSTTRTLADEEIEAWVTQIVVALQESCGALRRDKAAG